MLTRRTTDLLFGLCCLGLAVGIGIYAYLGTFSRYWADDYCYSAMVVENGLWGAIENFNQTIITSRYSAFLVIIFSESLGFNTVRFLPLILIGLLLLSLTWLSVQLLRRLRFDAPFLSGLVLAETAVFFTLLMAPNRFQSVYWRAANITYLGSLVMGVGLSALFLYLTSDMGIRLSGYKAQALFLVVAVLAGGFSETLTAVMLGGMIIFFLIIYLNIWKTGLIRQVQLRMLGTGMLGFGIALLLLFLSPTNAYRMGVLTTSLDPAIQIMRSIQFSMDFVLESFKGLPVPFVILLSASGIIAYRQYYPIAGDNYLGPKLPVLGLIPLTGFGLVFFSFAPSVYGQSAFPEGRTLIIGRFIIIVAVLIWGVAVGILMRIKIAAFQKNKPEIQKRMIMVESTGLMIVVLLLIIYPIRSALETASSIPEYKDRAEEWDLRDRQIRELASSGVQDIEVKGMENLYDVYELSPEPDLWVNRCAARYYQIDSIIAIP